jgi:hypothetical protein
LPITHQIFKGKIRDNLHEKFEVISDTGLPDHPDVAIDARKYVWIEASSSHYECEKCHPGRWNVSSGSPVHSQRLGWIKDMNSPTLPEKPPGQEPEDERLKPRQPAVIPFDL